MWGFRCEPVNQVWDPTSLRTPKLANWNDTAEISWVLLSAHYQTTTEKSFHSLYNYNPTNICTHYHPTKSHYKSIMNVSTYFTLTSSHQTRPRAESGTRPRSKSPELCWTGEDTVIQWIPNSSQRIEGKICRKNLYFMIFMGKPMPSCKFPQQHPNKMAKCSILDLARRCIQASFAKCSTHWGRLSMKTKRSSGPRDPERTSAEFVCFKGSPASSMNHSQPSTTILNLGTWTSIQLWDNAENMDKHRLLPIPKRRKIDVYDLYQFK